jgi:hypothetical protein
VLALVAPAGASARWGSPHVKVLVSSGELGPAREVVVEGSRLDRVVFEFDIATKWWAGRKLVLHADEGVDRFEARYFLLSADGWKPITSQVTSDDGYFHGYVAGSRQLRVRLVVTVETIRRWGKARHHRFHLSAGTSASSTHLATGIVRSFG